MNLYGFIASVIGSLAWPLLIAWIVLLLLRRSKSLEDLIQKVRKYVKSIKMGALELTFQDAREDAEAVAVERGTPLPDQGPLNDKLLQLASINPALAVVEIWKDLEAEIISLIQHNGMMRFTRPTHFMRVLAEKKKITRNELALYERLRSIRNEAVHSRDPQPLTVAEISEYRSFVSALIARFQQIKAEPGYIDVPMPENKPSI